MDYETILRPQRVCLGRVTHEVKVTRINNRYHCRVFTDGILNQEGVANSRKEISYVCRDLLRWEDKCGNISDFATSARNKINTQPPYYETN